MGSEKGTHNEKNMKLSQKLLALSGVAFADYAYCPYDDYGIPDAECDVSEKTPFSADETWNGNSCKAWEGNVDALTQTERQAGVDSPLYGSPLAADQKTYQSLIGNSNDATNIVSKGANFDVVAHFNHDFCTTFWTEEDMQMPGDWGNGGTIDYPDGTGTLSHVHTDTTDKRFASPAAVALWNTRYTSDGSAMTAPSGGSVRWPNAGAYAGFYSFVACANPDTVDYTHTNY